MRRRTLTPILLAVVLALALVTVGSGPGTQATAQAPVVLKIQASWPASLTIYDHLKLVAERVDKLSGGTLKIEPLPTGTIVPAFEVLDATNKKVLDGAHTSPTTGSARTGRPRSSAAPAARSAWTASTTWAGSTTAAGSSCTASSSRRCSSRTWCRSRCLRRAPGHRLVQAAGQELGRPEGPQVPPDRDLRRGLLQVRHGDRQHAGQRDPAGGRARRHRLRRVGRAQRRHADRLPHGVEALLHAVAARPSLLEILINGDVWKSLSPGPAGDHAGRPRSKPRCAARTGRTGWMPRPWSS